MMADDAEMDEEIERQLEAEARNNIYDDTMQKLENDVSYTEKRYRYIIIVYLIGFLFDF
jgi:hypothetical protein